MKAARGGFLKKSIFSRIPSPPVLPFSGGEGKDRKDAGQLIFGGHFEKVEIDIARLYALTLLDSIKTGLKGSGQAA